jgi:hypothetical protein
MDNCSICFENLSVPSFRERQEEILVENDCSTLKCGHGFHTKCLLQSLQSIQGCPICRLVNDEDFFDPRLRAQQRLHMNACCDTIIRQVKNDKLKDHAQDYNAFKKELEEKRKLFKASVATFKEKLRKDMNIEGIINYLNQLRKHSKRIIRSEIKKKGGIFASAMKLRYYREDMIFDGVSAWNFSWKNKRDFW